MKSKILFQVEIEYEHEPEEYGSLSQNTVTILKDYLQNAIEHMRQESSLGIYQEYKGKSKEISANWVDTKWLEITHE